MTDTAYQTFIKREKSEALDAIFPALSHDPVVSVRLNREKTLLPPVSLPVEGKVPWEGAGYYLAERPRFTFDPRLHQGLYYVQEASSMILGHIMRYLSQSLHNVPLAVLDACAAPGGKTTLILDNLPEGSALVANEFDFSRAEILRENLSRWGHANVAVTRGDTKTFSRLRSGFDIILADMPCSGEGMFRKDAEAQRQWSEALVQKCAARQLEIADNLLPALTPGGYFIYSTCTFNTLENERNVERICEEYDLETVEIPVEKEWGISGAVNSDIHALRFLPQKVKGEGLFVSVMRKQGIFNPRAIEFTLKKKPEAVEGWTRGLVVWQKDDSVWGATPALASLLEKAGKKLDNLLAQGLEIARVKGHDIIPTHQLALSLNLNSDAFEDVELSDRDALAYLRRENITLPGGTPKGYILVNFQGQPLGMVKNMGNRVNNLLPKEWRIRN